MGKQNKKSLNIRQYISMFHLFINISISDNQIRNQTFLSFFKKINQNTQDLIMLQSLFILLFIVLSKLKKPKKPKKRSNQSAPQVNLNQWPIIIFFRMNQLTINEILQKAYIRETQQKDHASEAKSFDTQFCPNAKYQKLPISAQNMGKKQRRPRINSWNESQSRKYVSFMIKHGDIYSLSHQERRKSRINIMMSKMVKTRTAAQCHSHHQKMIKKHGSVQKIIENCSYLLKNQSMDMQKSLQSSTPSVKIQKTTQNQTFIQVDDFFHNLQHQQCSIIFFYEGSENQQIHDFDFL